MTPLLALHGVTALALLCVLLGLEEAGVPLLLLPGDGLLITAGVLITNHAFSAWAFFPLAFLSMVAGALGAYSWSRAIGPKAVNKLSVKLRAEKAVARVSRRLQHATPLSVFTARLLPGLRIYTNIVAGAFGVPLPTFALGMVPSVIIWVAGFTLLGIVVGLPAAHFLSNVGQVVVSAGAVVLIAVLAGILLRRIPPARRHDALLGPTNRWRVAAAVVLDLLIVVTIAAGLAALVAEILNREPHGIIDFEILVVVTAAIYVALARVITGATAGEHLFGVSYYRGRRATGHT